jgi:putative ABC transport system permease protein
VNESNASMLIQLDSKGDINAVRDQLKKWVAPEQIVLNRQLLTAQQMQVEEELTIGNGGYEFLYIVPSFILVIATVAFIYNTFQISIAQRIRHIGLMRALGATRRHVRNMVLYEATILSLIAIPIGLFCGVGVVWFVSFLFKTFFEGGEYSLLHIQVIVSPTVLGISTAISLIAVYLSVWLPTRMAGRVSPLAVIREGYSISKRKRKAKNLKLFSRLAGIETLITYRSMRSNKRRLYSTIFSLALSVFLFSTFTGLARMLSSDLSGFEQHADFTLYNYSSEYNPIMEQLPEQLNKLDDIKHIYVNYPDYSVQTIVPANSKSSMLGYEVMVDQIKHRSLYGTLSIYAEDNEPWLKNAQIKGDITAIKDDREHGVIFVQKEGPYKLQLQVGDELYLSQTETNRDRTTYDSSQLLKIKVLAVIQGDASFPTFIADRKVIEALFPDASDSNSINSIDIALKNIEQERQVGQRLEAMVEQDPRIEVRSHLQAKRDQEMTQLQFIVMLYGFIGVIVLISIINMVNTMMMNFIARTKEFAMLQSVGMSRHALHTMLVKEGILYGVLSGLIGVIFAGFIMLKLSSGSQSTESHATVSETWIWINLMITFLGTVLIGYLSARIALKSCKGVNIINLLKGE